MGNALLTEDEVAFIREELRTARNPLFIFDDDADGLPSFLLLYKIHREGKGIPLKISPLDNRLLRKVEEINPDKIFILDIPVVTQDFIDNVNRPIIWIDHHMPLERSKVHYFNPRSKDISAYIPTTRMAWQISQNPADLWIATAGCLADYHLPDFIDEARKQYPELLPREADLPTTVFKEPISILVKAFFFLLKGPMSEVHKSIKILTRIEHPDEILKQTTPQGKFLHKRFVGINKKYDALLKQARKTVTRSNLLLFQYAEDQWSFTANLANELSSLYPDKVILITRKKGGEMKCSIRARFPILVPLEKALHGIDGAGGGHPEACGAVIKEQDWERFVENFKRELKK